MAHPKHGLKPAGPAAAGALSALILTASGLVEAHATGSLSCSGVDEDVSVELTLGTLPVLAVVGGRIATPSGHYAINPQGGETPIIVGQAFGDTRGISVDFTDPNIMQVLISLRTVRGEGDKQVVEAGVLTVEQTEVYAVSCLVG